MSISSKRIGLIVTGGIAAYKICYLVRQIRASGGNAIITMTYAATKFITPLSLATLSGNPVNCELFPQVSHQNPIHLEIANDCDILIVAPATASFIGKLANGIPDDLATCVAMAFGGKTILAPAMNPRMWENPAVQANVATLTERGIKFVGPDEGEMAGVNEEAGLGRMSEPEVIFENLLKHIEDQPLLDGYKVLITSGPTREKIDPVRYVSNYSSGKMGNALANQAFRMGAEVTMVRGKGCTVPPALAANVIDVDSAAEMFSAVKQEFVDTDLLVLTAAVADWTVDSPAVEKLKKSDGAPSISWQATDDIAHWAGLNRNKQVLVGFALENSNHHARADKKLKDKKIDLIALNDTTQHHSEFGGDSTQLTIFSNDNQPKQLPVGTKQEAARKLLEIAAGYLPEKHHSG